MPVRVAVILGGSGFVGRHLAPRLAAHGWLGRARGRAAVGQETFTFRELLERMLAHLGKRRLILPVPFGLARALAAGLERLLDPPLTREEVRLLRTDKVVGGLPTPADLGLAARPSPRGCPTRSAPPPVGGGKAAPPGGHGPSSAGPGRAGTATPTDLPTERGRRFALPPCLRAAASRPCPSGPLRAG